MAKKITNIIHEGDLVPCGEHAYIVAKYHGRCSDNCDLHDGERCPGLCYRYRNGDDYVFHMHKLLERVDEDELTLTEIQAEIRRKRRNVIKFGEE